MSDRSFLPRLLIIDDLFSRTHPDRRNVERANLCGQYLIEDITGDELGKGTPQRIKKPVAQGVFCRGQTPACSTVGDIVENDLESTLRVTRQGWGERCPANQRWSMILLDLCFYTGRVTEASNRRALGMPEGRDGDENPKRYFGLQILEAIRQEFPDLPVIILSSKPREEVSREFSQRGALGFLARDAADSPDLLMEYIWRHGLIPDDTGEIVGHSKPLLLALRTARRMASNERNILVRGERGSGKELLARYIHRQSTVWKKRPFIPVDSGTLNPNLYGSELFGHKQGAFTGANREHDGWILQANNGDLFLDEIGNTPPDVQRGLLRILESREVIPVGATKGQAVNVRFLSATNEDIEAKAFTGNGFRSDLLDRLREGGTIFIPPLRERMEDIPLLVEKFVREAESANPKALRRQVDPEVLDMLSVSDWLGNIRELRNCIFRAVNSYPDVEHLVPVHLQFPSLKKFNDETPLAAPTPTAPTSSDAIEANPFDKIVRELSDFSFESVNPEHLAGKLPEIEDGYARFIARYLKAALKANTKFTPQNPQGEIKIHPTMKLITGNAKLSASKAADVIKRQLNLSPQAVEPLLSDPILKEAYDTAVRLRPRSQKSSGKRKKPR